ncbi:MAG: hypothetical protein L3J67_12515 [Hyphomicrobiaceae bacterium]|nr:hypothetical protein [Hyphomicrobiaceae bacterium]
MSEKTKFPGLPVGERDRLCRVRAITLWQRVAELPEPYRYNTLFELVKIWVERTPPDQLDDLAADLRGRARCAEQKSRQVDPNRARREGDER